MPSKKIIINKISKKIKKHKKTINNLIFVFGLFLILFSGIVLLDNYELIAISKIIVDVLKNIIIVISTYFIASIFVKLTSFQVLRIIREEQLEEKIMVSKFYTGIIYLLATAFVLWYIGVSIQNIALISGLIATGLAFALREVLLSYFVWLILLIKKPFKIGDNIKIGSDEGIVRHIGMFYVVLDQNPKEVDSFVKIPNKNFIDKSIYNYKKKEIPLKISVKIDSSNKNISSKLIKLNKNIKSVKIYEKAHLETINEYLYVSLKVICKYNERNEVKTKIIEDILNIFKN